MNGEEIRRYSFVLIDRSSDCRKGREGWRWEEEEEVVEEEMKGSIACWMRRRQSMAFDKLTDRVEDHQLDSTRVQEAMASIAASAEANRSAMRLREKELAAVKINSAEVDIIANELELDRKVVERTLRQHKGDAVASIRSLLSLRS